MTINGNQNSGGDAGGTASGAPATVPQPDWESDSNPYKQFKEFEARFKGMQAEYGRLQGEHKTLAGTYSTLEEQFKAAVGQRESLSLEHDKLKGEHAKATDELTSLRAQFERTRLVLSEFPDLAQLEARGLLPTGQGDDLKKKLAEFRDTLKGMSSQQAAQIVVGGTPQPPNPQQPKTADALRKSAEALQLQGKHAEADEVWDQYFKALAS